VSFFATIHEEAVRRKLRFLVIGGLAVNHYGYARETADLDFFISRDDRAGWMKLLHDFGYTSHNDGGNFIQFNPPAQNAWPVDLMLVQEKTFSPILEASQAADLFGVRTHVPSLEHLLALKLHALKNTRMSRFLKDFLDVEYLIRLNRLDIQSKNIRELFEKYGTPDLYEKVSRSLAGE
jgi:predicted nucleotidyltransferase